MGGTREASRGGEINTKQSEEKKEDGEERCGEGRGGRGDTEGRGGWARSTPAAQTTALSP